MSTQTLLRIALPADVRVFPSQFRERLAKDGDLPASFFHYDAGRPMTGTPTVRIVGGKTWVGILACGANQYDLVSEAMTPAVRALNLQGRVLRTAIETFEFGVADSHLPQTYFIREMTIKRRHVAARLADDRDLVTERLRQGLIRQFCENEFYVPDDFPLMVTEVIRPRGLHLKTANGKSNEYVTLLDAQFVTPLNLSGFWFAGNLTARGYGRIIRDAGQFVAAPSKEAA